MNSINSRKHDDIKLVNALHQADKRREHGLFIAEGIRVIQTLISSKIKLKQLYILQERSQDVIDTLKKLCADHGYNEQFLTTITQSVLEKISCTKSPSGVLGVFFIPTPQTLKNLSHGIVLANISSPGNMGTIIRSAAAFAANCVVIVDGTDVWGPKVVQASAGTLGMIPIIESSWQELIEAKKDLSLCALVVSGGQSPSTINKNQSLIVVGNEAHGLPKEWANQCEKQITIAMPGKTESLNAALAASIALYATGAD